MSEATEVHVACSGLGGMSGWAVRFGERVLSGWVEGTPYDAAVTALGQVPGSIEVRTADETLCKVLSGRWKPKKHKLQIVALRERVVAARLVWSDESRDLRQVARAALIAATGMVGEERTGG